jgi:hypothetical protein
MWTAYHSLTDSLPDKGQEVVTRLTNQAMSYVWGFQDAGGEVKDTERASQFGWAYGIVAGRYEHAQIGSRPAIQDAWRSWQEHGEIRNYNGERLDVVHPS